MDGAIKQGVKQKKYDSTAALIFLMAQFAGLTLLFLPTCVSSCTCIEFVTLAQWCSKLQKIIVLSKYSKLMKYRDSIFFMHVY